MDDIRLWFDPVCPFCWMTSKWIRRVATQRDAHVEWCFISLRLLNADVDYGEHFPSGYEHGHTAGLRMLRAAARVREEDGPEALDRLHQGFGAAVFEVPDPDREAFGTREHVARILADAGLSEDAADAVDDPSWDQVIQAETDDALKRTGRDVGTPIIQVGDGPGFFGPVISRLPSDEDALVLWDHVVGLVGFPGFAELKRSLRERPQLPALGVAPDDVGVTEDWHAGRRPAQP